uniref:rab proteins geranylgeranyltransferase component A 2-like n=1 Tax=Styela clava TaxID=7725 RepID=UPI00193A7F16|nr:rab proteins geranylgeranyltransferase component A 2-like [Styela clava]
MMNEELANDFDIIVVGTGLSESILSGALSRIGKRVLHLDQNKYYGSNWSSFNLRAFEAWIEERDDDARVSVNEISQEINNETEELVIVGNIRKTTQQGVVKCYLPDVPKPSSQLDQDLPLADELKSDVNSKSKDVSGEGNDQSFTQHAQRSPVSEDIETIQQIDQKQMEDLETMDNGADKQETETKNEELKNSEEAVEKIGESSGILKNLAKQDNSKSIIDDNSKEYFYSKWRHYNLDLAPKLMFSRGKLVDLLITSNVSRYLEFRNVTRTLTLLNNGENTLPKLAPVPCSRTDVFTSKFVTMIEKRMLMRVLTMCANYESHPEEYAEFEDKKFIEFLAAKKLSKKLQHFILHSISMVDENTNTVEGLKATQKFLNSLGRYGNSAFLWPLYGVGELPQAFCRLGAVFGGTFCLSRSLHALIINKESKKCVGIIDSTGQRLRSEQLILDECYVPEINCNKFTNIISRAIYVTDCSLLQADKENMSLITIPPMLDLPSSRLIELGPSSCVCPPKYHVVHAMTSIESTSEDFLPSPQSKFCKMEEILFDKIDQISDADVSKQESKSTEQEATQTSHSVVESECEKAKKPRVLWSAYFNMLSGGVKTQSLPSNLYVTKGPNMDLGFDETVSEAQRLFEAICPDEEFLPRAPNPDEIVYFDQDDEGYTTETNGTQNDRQQQQDMREYQEDESEVDAGTGEPPDQVQTSEEIPNDSAQFGDLDSKTL